MDFSDAAQQLAPAIPSCQWSLKKRRM